MRANELLRSQQLRLQVLQDGRDVDLRVGDGEHLEVLPDDLRVRLAAHPHPVRGAHPECPLDGPIEHLSADLPDADQCPVDVPEDESLHPASLAACGHRDQSGTGRLNHLHDASYRDRAYLARLPRHKMRVRRGPVPAVSHRARSNVAGPGRRTYA